MQSPSKTKEPMRPLFQKWMSELFTNQHLRTFQAHLPVGLGPYPQIPVALMCRRTWPGPGAWTGAPSINTLWSADTTSAGFEWLVRSVPFFVTPLRTGSVSIVALTMAEIFRTARTYPCVVYS